ncbi:hypothetical protein P9314_11285 [Paenibacillus validus]|nr:hypothetical protein [Paenibacillus validus]MED4601286.1 hypothetical protein [Paenibacillus validus]MED4605949.1 hypothetical protein [Paenibacillus validus]
MDGQPVTIRDGEDQAHFDTGTGMLTYTAKALIYYISPEGVLVRTLGGKP